MSRLEWQPNSIAVSPNNNLVQIYDFKGGKFTLVHTLAEHSQRVVGLDWAAKTNRIVSSGEDRNAYVWKLGNDGKWKPGLVVLRINRAATCVKWSPSEEKFAVGSGARIVSVCHFQEENDWWVAKNIKSGIRSTVTCLCWHPDSSLLAVGSSDFQARIFSAAVKGVDKKPEANAWANTNQIRTFGTMLHQWRNEADGWIHDIAFSPSGERLVWVSQSSTVSFVDSKDLQVQNVLDKLLPHCACLFAREDIVIAAGHSYLPCLYKCVNGKWKFDKKLEEGLKSQSSDVDSAMSKFKKMDFKSQVDSAVETLNSTHQNAITEILANFHLPLTHL